MSAHVYINGEFALFGSRPRPVIECDEDGCIWIRHGSDTVALKLTADQFATLQSAIAEALAHDDLPVEEA